MHVSGNAALKKLHEATAELGCVCMCGLLGAIGVTVPYRLHHRRVVGSDIPHTIWLKHLVFKMNMQHASPFIKYSLIE